MYVINQSQLPFVGMSHEFVGMDHGDVGISFFLVIGEPGRGPRLHKHDYDEVVYVIEGRSKWTVGDQEREPLLATCSSSAPAYRTSSWILEMASFDKSTFI